MKYLSITCLVLLGMLSTTNTNAQGNSQVEFYKGVYHNSLKYNDLQSATNAVYGILTVAPDQTGWKDTLAYLYYNDNRFVQALLVGLEITQKSDTNQNILEIVAISQQNMNLLKESLENYEKLFKMSKSIFHEYKIATLQYALKRFGECGVTIDQILQSKDSGQEISISDNNRRSQKVPIKAAVLNMRGVIALELNQNDAAKQNFEAALKITPDFELAKNNLDVINKPKGETKAATTPTPAAPKPKTTQKK